MWWKHVVAWGCLLGLLASACGDDDGGTRDAGGDVGEAVDAGTDAFVPPMDWPAVRPDESIEIEPGIVREVRLVPGTTPPPNPDTGDATPEELNHIQVVRFRRAGDPAPEARAIVVGMPGFLGGAGSLEGIARAVVRTGVDGAPAEFWAIDRRSNQLEDLAGMDAAEAMGDPEIAYGYYFGDDTIGGEPFGGYIGGGRLDYMSEWGLRTHVEDVHALIALVPEAERRERVFFLGHSLGASFAEAYAAWRFEDGTRGADELAGLILVDGVLGGAPITEMEYREGTMGGFIPRPGLDDIRNDGNQRYVAFPLLGIDVYSLAEISALRAELSPEEVVEDVRRDRVLATLMGLSVPRIPNLTNEAAFAAAFDDDYQPVSIIRTKLGEFTGGPVETYAGIFDGEDLLRPSDPDATYAWVDALETDPPEVTPLLNLARGFYLGRTNYAEWYFPARLSLDLAAVGGAAIPEDGYGADEGLRAFDGALDDAPILCVAAGLVPVASYDAVVPRVAGTLGEGRVHAGLGRDDARAFSIIDATDQAHLDPTIADERNPSNPVPPAVTEFLMTHTRPEGGVSVVFP